MMTSDHISGRAHVLVIILLSSLSFTEMYINTSCTTLSISYLWCFKSSILFKAGFAKENLPVSLLPIGEIYPFFQIEK